MSDSIWVQTLLGALFYAVPLVLAAIGETIYQKSGQINLGLEGIMICGSFGALQVFATGGSPWMAMLGGMGLGLAMGVLQSLFVLTMRRDQIVVGVALNLLALGLTNFFFREQFGQSGTLLKFQTLPTLFAGRDLVFWLQFLLVPVTAWVLWRTKWGLALRATGESPSAVSAAGFSPGSLRWQAAILAALLGGAAGAYLVAGVTGSYTENMSAGKGFLAIALVTFGRWSPYGVYGACLLIAGADAARYQFQAQGLFNLPDAAWVALPYLIALLVLMFVDKGGKEPQSLGVPLPDRMS